MLYYVWEVGEDSFRIPGFFTWPVEGSVIYCAKEHGGMWAWWQDEKFNFGSLFS